MLKNIRIALIIATIFSISIATPAYANNYSGSGDAVVETKSTSKSVLVNVSHAGNSNFIIWAKNGAGDNVDLVTNEIGSHSGVRFLELNKRNKLKYFEVTADGVWTIDVKPLKTATKWKGSSISGSGNQVIKTPKKLKSNSKIKMQYDGASNFIIWSYNSNGSRQNLIVNEIGTYSGTKFFGRNATYLEIVSDGAWTLTIQ